MEATGGSSQDPFWVTGRLSPGGTRSEWRNDEGRYCRGGRSEPKSLFGKNSGVIQGWGGSAAH